MQILKWTLIWLYVIVVAYVCMRGCVLVEGAEEGFSFRGHEGDMIFKSSEVVLPDRREIMWLYMDGCILAFTIDKDTGAYYDWCWIRKADHRRIM